MGKVKLFGLCYLLLLLLLYYYTNVWIVGMAKMTVTKTYCSVGQYYYYTSLHARLDSPRVLYINLKRSV